MGNRYDHHHHHHHQNVHNQRSIFLPMFCRLSINDVKLNNTLRRNQTPAAGEPSSPKVSCIGQVKRNNRVIACPAAAAAAANHHPKNTPSRKKPLAGKPLLPSAAAGSRSCRVSGREIARVKKSRRLKSSVRINDQDLAGVAEMDPPLPVVKRVVPAGAGREEVNLWKRRFNGAAGGLKTLEIQNIHSPECKFERSAASSV